MSLEWKTKTGLLVLLSVLALATLASTQLVNALASEGKLTVYLVPYRSVLLIYTYMPKDQLVLTELYVLQSRKWGRSGDSFRVNNFSSAKIPDIYIRRIIPSVCHNWTSPSY